MEDEVPAPPSLSQLFRAKAQSREVTEAEQVEALGARMKSQLSYDQLEEER